VIDRPDLLAVSEYTEILVADLRPVLPAVPQLGDDLKEVGAG
jgi:hypothetical protein